MQHAPHPLRNTPGVSEYVRTYFRTWFTAAKGRGSGMPTPEGIGDRRTWGTVVLQVPNGLPLYTPYKFYDPGGGAAGYKSGVLERNPIGSGVVFKQKLNIFPYKVGTYMAGAIWWNTTQNGTGGPALHPLLNPAQLDALLVQSGGAAITAGAPAVGGPAF